LFSFRWRSKGFPKNVFENRESQAEFYNKKSKKEVLMIKEVESKGDGGVEALLAGDL